MDLLRRYNGPNGQQTYEYNMCLYIVYVRKSSFPVISSDFIFCNYLAVM